MSAPDESGTLTPPPHDIAAEMSVLGSMMLDSGVAVSEAEVLLSDTDFYRDVHRHLFRAMVALVNRGQPCDIVTLRAALDQAGILEKIGGTSYLMQLGEVEFTTSNLPHYAAIVRDRAILRRVMEEAAAIFHQARSGGEPDGDAMKFLAQVQERILRATTPEKGGDGFKPLKEVLSEAWEEFDLRHKDRNLLTGFPTGFSTLDEITGGLQDGDLIVLAARPAMGKTAMLCNICMDAAKHHRRVAFFSLEMPRVQIAARMICAGAKVDSHKYRTPTLLSEEEHHRLSDANSLLWTSEVHIDDTSGLTISDICARACRLHARGPLDLVMVDYLQQIASDDRDRKSENRVQEVTAMIRRLKTLARQLNCPVVVLSQLSRAVKKREDKRPMLSDLYESGGIEAAADMVLALYRPAYYAAKEHARPGGDASTAPEEAEVLFLKYRNGDTGVAKMGFVPRFAQFYDLAPEWRQVQ